MIAREVVILCVCGHALYGRKQFLSSTFQSQHPTGTFVGGMYEGGYVTIDVANTLLCIRRVNGGISGVLEKHEACH